MNSQGGTRKIGDSGRCQVVSWDSINARSSLMITIVFNQAQAQYNISTHTRYTHILSTHSIYLSSLSITIISSLTMSQFRTVTPLLRRSTQNFTQNVIRIPRRQLSTIQSLRTAIKSFEHNTGIPLHLPQTARQQGHAASDWGKQIKKATTTSML